LLPGFFMRGLTAKQATKPAPGEKMADKKTKDAAPKKEPAPESNAADAAPKTEGAKTEGAKTEGAKTEGAKPDGVTAEAAKPDAAPKKQAMGEGQKPVTQAYKDNWDAIFGKKKKR
jgi:hypothetical protein